MCNSFFFRYLSMANHMGDEDFFSPDLTNNEIFSKFPRREREKGEKENERDPERRKRISGLVLLMGRDEYVPKEVNQMSLFQRICDIVCVQGGKEKGGEKGQERGEEEKMKEEEKKEKEEEEQGRLFERFDVVEIEGAKHYCEEEKNCVFLVEKVVLFLNNV